MNISEVRDLLEGASYEGEIEVLETIWNYVGDSVLNGYLGSSVETVSFDEDGRLEFDSRFETEEVLKKHNLPDLDPDLLVDEKELEEELAKND